MCGIAGFIGQGNPELLKKMTNILLHRGPDDEGFYFEDNVGLGHRRLSIIDLSPSAHQPMSNEDGTIWITFNGEIYNFLDLRGDLISKGHKFKSNSDTEAIVHAYEEYGNDFFNKIDGMFALAIYDTRENRLLLARDRLGKKPLYYSYQKGNFVFASELKALRVYPYIDFVLDNDQIKKYFFYDYVPCPFTPWKDVYKLEPGQFLVFKSSEAQLDYYWKNNFSISESENDTDFFQAKSKLDLLLETAVKARLISDVPLGVFLSGGIDSSTIAWYAQRLAGEKIKTFSIDFEEKSFGEGDYAREVARIIGSEHCEEVLSQKKALDILEHIGENMDEPLADASILPTYLLSKFTKGSVTVALSGDGADELFCGYQTFQAEKLYGFYKLWPDILKTAVKRLSKFIPSSTAYFSFDFKIKKFLDALDEPILRHQNWLSSFSLEDLNNLFAGISDLDNVIFSDIVKFQNNFSGPDARDDFSNVAAYYQRFYMQERVLVKVDRASMLSSLEVRSPFLDHNVVEFANSLPSHIKMKNFRTKHILKSLMMSRLPRQIIERPKKGFAVPLGDWFRAELKDVFMELLNRRRIDDAGIINYPYVMKLLNEHNRSSANHGQKLWSMLVFLMWRDKFC